MKMMGFQTTCVRAGSAKGAVDASVIADWASVETNEVMQLMIGTSPGRGKQRYACISYDKHP